MTSVPGSAATSGESGVVVVGEITVTWERGAAKAFEDLPEKSIALDGYVSGPQIDPVGERYSFDHHGGCIRLVTSATCRQVLDALSLGLEPWGMNVLVNDVDGDTALSVALLAHPEWCSDRGVRHLVDVVATFDAHGPGYPSEDPGLVHQFFLGAMRPEASARADGTYTTCDLGELAAACVAGIEELVAGGDVLAGVRRGSGPVWSVTHSGTGWVMISGGPGAFGEAYRAGHRRIVAWQQERDGSWSYTVAKQSDFVTGFPVGPASEPGTILAALVDVEPGWGGGSTIGGAPRNTDGTRSSLAPGRVFAIVEGVVAGSA